MIRIHYSVQLFLWLCAFLCCFFLISVWSSLSTGTQKWTLQLRFPFPFHDREVCFIRYMISRSQHEAQIICLPHYDYTHSHYSHSLKNVVKTEMGKIQHIHHTLNTLNAFSLFFWLSHFIWFSQSILYIIELAIFIKSTEDDSEHCFIIFTFNMDPKVAHSTQILSTFQ
jgi:hypothetical protein